MSGCGCEKRSQEEESKDSYLSYFNHVLSVISESEERGRRGGFHCYYAAILAQETSNDFSHKWYHPFSLLLYLPPHSIFIMVIHHSTPIHSSPPLTTILTTPLSCPLRFLLLFSSETVPMGNSSSKKLEKQTQKNAKLHGSPVPPSLCQGI